MVSFALIAVLFVGVGNVALGVLVLSQRLQERYAKIFFLLSISLAVYALVSYSSNLNYLGIQYQKLALKFDFLSGLFSAYLFFLFTHEYPKRLGTLSKYWQFLFASAVLSLSVLIVATDLILGDVRIVARGIEQDPGQLDLIFISVVLCFIILGLAGFYRQYKSAEGIEKLKIAYLVLGAGSVASISAIAVIFERIAATIGYQWANELAFFILPSIIRYSIPLFTVITAYAILRHRLFGIRIVIGHLFFWLGAAIFLFVSFYIIALAEIQHVGSLTHPYSIALNIVLAVLLGVIFHAFEKRLKTLINRFIINHNYDPAEVREGFIARTAEAQTMQDVTKELFNTVSKTLGPSKQGAEVGVVASGQGEAVGEWEEFSNEEVKVIEQEDILNSFLVQSPNKPILRTEVGQFGLGEKVEQWMEKLGIEVVVPVQYAQIVGVYLLGARRDKQAYTVEDLDFLEKLVYYASLNMNRAR